MVEKFKEFSEDYAAQQTDTWDRNSVKKVSEDIQDNLKKLNPNEQNDYLHARLIVAKASIRFLNDDLSYVCGTDGVVNYCCIEKDLLSGFIKENPSKRGKTVFETLNHSYVESIYFFAEIYGFTKNMVADKLNEKIIKLSASAEM